MWIVKDKYDRVQLHKDKPSPDKDSWFSGTFIGYLPDFTEIQVSDEPIEIEVSQKNLVKHSTYKFPDGFSMTQYYDTRLPEPPTNNVYFYISKNVYNDRYKTIIYRASFESYIEIIFEYFDKTINDIACGRVMCPTPHEFLKTWDGILKNLYVN